MTKPCHLACERIYDTQKTRKCFVRPTHRIAPCLYKSENLQWIRVHRRLTQKKAVAQVVAIDPRYEHKDFEGWPTAHRELLDALASPYGNELWKGTSCSRNHNYCANRTGKMFCAALLERVETWELQLACLRGLIDAAKEAGPEAKASLFILMDATTSPYTAEVPVRTMGEHLVNGQEPGSIPWKYGTVLVHASPIFSDRKIRGAGESLSSVRNLIEHLQQHFPGAVASIGHSNELGLWAERGKVVTRAARALGPRAHQEILGKVADGE